MEEIIIKVNEDTQTVSARELHEKLNIEKRFSAWFETNSQGFIEGEDFNPYLKVQVQLEGEREVKREFADYLLSVDMAKHICLMSRTEQGKQCRQYLIDLEKAWNTPEQILARALKVADQTIASLHTKVAELQPKADFFDAVADSKTAISMNEVAKVLDLPGLGRNKLFEFLRNEGILDRYNVPYQRYVDCGWFRVIEQKYTRNGEQMVTTKTLVYQKGVDAIRKRVLAG